jgi:transposase
MSKLPSDLASRRNQSGERDYNGRISKAGDPMLRLALGHLQQPDDLSRIRQVSGRRF